jgi:hypothetical protein
MQRVGTKIESEDIMHPAAAIKLVELTIGKQPSFADIRADRERPERKNEELELPSENTD